LAAFAWQRSCCFTRLAAARSLAAAHLLGSVSVNAVATLPRQSSATSRQIPGSPAQEPALPKAATSLAACESPHAASPARSPLAVALDWHRRRLVSYLPIAPSFALRHLPDGTCADA